VTRSSIALFFGALLACSGVQIAPQAPRPPVTEAELAKLDGAKYVKRFEYREGFQVHTWQIHGNQIARTWYASYGGAPETTDTYSISHGTVYIPNPEAGYCYSVVNSRDCGLRVTITPEALYFTRIADGQVAEQQYSTNGESLEPVFRKK
jgi:hypothetical protein